MSELCYHKKLIQYPNKVFNNNKIVTVHWTNNHSNWFSFIYKRMLSNKIAKLNNIDRYYIQPAYVVFFKN